MLCLATKDGLEDQFKLMGRKGTSAGGCAMAFLVNPLRCSRPLSHRPLTAVNRVCGFAEGHKREEENQHAAYSRAGKYQEKPIPNPHLPKFYS